MANQYKNEVIYNGQTLLNLTNDTVASDKVLEGITFHDRSGAPQTGNLITHNVYDGLDSTSTNDALSANQGRQLNSKIKNVAPYQYINIDSGASATVSRTKDICLIYGIQRGSSDSLMDIYSTLNDAVRHIGKSSVLSYTFTETTLTVTNAASQNVNIAIIA